MSASALYRIIHGYILLLRMISLWTTKPRNILWELHTSLQRTASSSCELLLPSGQSALTLLCQFVTYLASGSGWSVLSHLDNLTSRWWYPAAALIASQGITSLELGMTPSMAAEITSLLCILRLSLIFSLCSSPAGSKLNTRQWMVKISHCKQHGWSDLIWHKWVKVL